MCRTHLYVDTDSSPGLNLQQKQLLMVVLLGLAQFDLCMCRTHLYGDIYSSPGLDLLQKQLLMVAFLGQADMPDELFGHALAVRLHPLLAEMHACMPTLALCTCHEGCCLPFYACSWILCAFDHGSVLEMCCEWGLHLRMSGCQVSVCQADKQISAGLAVWCQAQCTEAGCGSRL